MKITHWNERKSNGKYRKKSKVKVFFRWVLLITIIVVALKAIGGDKTVTIEQKDICNGNSLCQQQIENLAAQTLLKAEITRIKAEYDSKLNNLETQLEELRKQELSLQ